METFAGDAAAIVRGAFEFDPAAYRSAVLLPNGWVVALAVVLIAGLSEEIGQSVVLFANRVRPQRFIFSLLVGTVLFAFGYLFLVASTWVIMLRPGGPHVPFATLATALGVSYVPYVFAFLGALPYAGFGIGWLLRTFHLVASVVAVSAVAGIGLFDALLYVGIGWTVHAIALQTLGKPIAVLGAKLLSAVAGVEIVADEQAAVDRIAEGPLIVDGAAAQAAGAGTVNVTRTAHSALWKAALGIAVMLAIGYVCAVALGPVHRVVFGWQDALPRAAQLPLNLLWIGTIGLLVAGFMAPVETLGWWAGWYGEPAQPARESDGDANADAAGDVKRYVVYLDGISQSGQKYMPDVEEFLDALSARLPPGTRLIRGLMAYSVINRPLDDDPILSWFWTWIDRLRLADPQSLLGMIVNIRNVLIVAVSSDRRYGPMYNFGIGRLVYGALLANGYRRGSGVAITLIGYSGGGQMSAASACYVKRALDAPVDVVSLGGVISGTARVLIVEHLYHFVGDKDGITRLGPLLFPSRWKIAATSSWNRARRLGRLSIHGLGPVGHQVPGGMMDPKLMLPDGQSALDQTLARIEEVLRDRVEPLGLAVSVTPPNYGRYLSAPFNVPEHYPLDSNVDSMLFRPQADWIGRLILPEREERQTVDGAWFEVHHAPLPHSALEGATLKLRWSDDPVIAEVVRAVRRDVHFSAHADHSSRFDGLIQPVRVDQWLLVGPLESLAGSHPIDDIIVALSGPVSVEDSVIRISRLPVQITGRYRALVQFVAPSGDDGYDVVHYNPATRAFDGAREQVRLPEVVTDEGGRLPSLSRGWENSPLNEDGWYAYGTHDASRTFVVQALLPRHILRLAPERTMARDDAYRYVHRTAWSEILRRKGSAFSVQLGEDQWQVGDRALLLHVYGGVGGKRGEKASSGPIYFGHFAFGFAEVVRDDHTGEPRFDFFFEQVYTQNGDGVISGALHMSRYLGDRQFGWIGLRPTCNVLLKLDAVGQAAGPHDAGAQLDTGVPLDALLMHLEAMTARYRIGDGTGCTYVGAANNCAQDSAQAMFGALAQFDEASAGERPRLSALVKDLRAQLAPFGSPRRDWSENQFNLGTMISDDPLEQAWIGLGSWRVILPRLANDTIAKAFLRNGASGWVIATGQLAVQPGIEPVAPTAL